MLNFFCFDFCAWVTMPGNEEMKILRYIDLHGGEIDNSMHFGVMHGVQ